MEFSETSLPGVLIVRPDVHRDDRGYFFESYQREKFAARIPEEFVQDNHSMSCRGTLRGLHLQHPHAQGKLLRATRGEVYDVAVDVRVGSPFFGKWFGTTLSADSFEQLYVPPGFAHGFCVLSDEAEVQYKCTRPYHPESELVIAWNDAAIGIDWPLESPEISSRDAAGASLASLVEQDRLPIYEV